MQYTRLSRDTAPVEAVTPAAAGSDGEDAGMESSSAMAPESEREEREERRHSIPSRQIEVLSMVLGESPNTLQQLYAQHLTSFRVLTHL